MVADARQKTTMAYVSINRPSMTIRIYAEISRLALSAFVVAVLNSTLALGAVVSLADRVLTEPALTDPIDAADASTRPNDFSVIIKSSHGDRPKFITFGWNGFSGGIVHWRYDDTNRSASISPSAASALGTIQTAMMQWQQVCNVTFIYDGTSTVGPSLAPPTSTFDGVNVVGWRSQTAPQTGVTGVGASGPGPTLIEADIAFNYTYDPIFAQTALHEVGHMIGINHSDVNNVVMSGPPTSTYSDQSILQADDINACVSLYGAPAATNRTITGTISNGSALSGVTFCARPASGVTCATSNASGAFSCTVPNGWTGLLHAAGPTGLRIKPLSFSNVTANLSGQNPLVQSIGACNLDVDNNGLIEPATDGVAILRRMLGTASGGFSGLSGTCAANTTSAAIFGATTLAGYNVTGAASVRATTDGAVIARAMNGVTGTAVTNSLGLAASGATRTDWTTNLRNYINTTCGSDFQ